MTEAVSLQGYQDAFKAETGIEFSFIFAMYSSASGEDATAEDCEAFADHIGAEFPVFADPGGVTISAATPMTTSTHPELCVITPDMELLQCFNGHRNIEPSLAQVRAHAGIE